MLSDDTFQIERGLQPMSGDVGEHGGRDICVPYDVSVYKADSTLYKRFKLGEFVSAWCASLFVGVLLSFMVFMVATPSERANGVNLDEMINRFNLGFFISLLSILTVAWVALRAGATRVTKDANEGLEAVVKISGLVAWLVGIGITGAKIGEDFKSGWIEIRPVSNLSNSHFFEVVAFLEDNLITQDVLEFLGFTVAFALMWCLYDEHKTNPLFSTEKTRAYLSNIEERRQFLKIFKIHNGEGQRDQASHDGEAGVAESKKGIGCRVKKFFCGGLQRVLVLMDGSLPIFCDLVVVGLVYFVFFLAECWWSEDSSDVVRSLLSVCVLLAVAFSLIWTCQRNRAFKHLYERLNSVETVPVYRYQQSLERGFLVAMRYSFFIAPILMCLDFLLALNWIWVLVPLMICLVCFYMAKRRGKRSNNLPEKILELEVVYPDLAPLCRLNDHLKSCSALSCWIGRFSVVIVMCRVIKEMEKIKLQLVSQAEADGYKIRNNFEGMSWVQTGQFYPTDT